MFKFAYQELLDYHKLLEEKAKEELNIHLILLSNTEKQIDRIKGVKSAYEKQLHEKQMKGERSGSVLLYLNYIERLEQELAFQKVEAQRLKKKITEIKNRLFELMKKRKMFEKLNDKAYAEYLKIQEQEELKKLNEFAVHSFNKKNGKNKE